MHGPLTVLASESAPVSTGVTLLFAAILVAMIACLALEEVIHAKKSIIVGAFAIVSLLLGAALLPLPYGPYLIGGHEMKMPVYVPSVDWEVIAIIVGSSLFVDVTSKSGLFGWIAIKLTKLSGGDPVKLLWFYGLMTVVFSAVLNNVTAMIIVGSLTGVSLNKLGRQNLLLGFLLTMGLLTNIGGLLTLISSVPNIIVGTTANISFMSFFFKASPFVAVATVGTIWMGAKLFGITSPSTEDERREAALLVKGFDENDGIESRGFFYFGGAMLLAFIVAIASASALPFHISDLGMGFIALSFAGIMLLRYRNEVNTFYRTLDWDLIVFFCALFMVINVMEHAQVLAMIGHGLEMLIGLGDTVGAGAILVSSAAASSVTDNIPLAAMLAKIMAGIPEVANDPASPFWWAVIFGANLGGNLTPIGSASTLVAVTIIHRNKIHLSFAGFVKAALPFALAQIAIALVYLLAVLRFF